MNIFEKPIRTRAEIYPIIWQECLRQEFGLFIPCEGDPRYIMNCLYEVRKEIPEAENFSIYIPEGGGGIYIYRKGHESLGDL